MLFGPKKRHRSHRGASQPSDPVDNEAVEQESRQWQAWRRSAQKVTRTWNEWLAAERHERAASYTRHISALHRGGTRGCRNRAHRQTRPCGERRERLHRPHRSYRWSEKRRRVRLQHGVTRQIAIVFVARFAGPRTLRAAMICRLPYNDERGLTGLVRPRSSVRLLELVTTLEVSRRRINRLLAQYGNRGQRIWFRRSPPVGQLVAGSRIPIQVYAAPIEADELSRRQGV